MASAAPYDTRTVRALRADLLRRRLDVAGTKRQLVERLLAADGRAPPQPPPAPPMPAAGEILIDSDGDTTADDEEEEYDPFDGGGLAAAEEEEPEEDEDSLRAGLATMLAAGTPIKADLQAEQPLATAPENETLVVQLRDCDPAGFAPPMDAGAFEAEGEDGEATEPEAALGDGEDTEPPDDGEGPPVDDDEDPSEPTDLEQAGTDLDAEPEDGLAAPVLAPAAEAPAASQASQASQALRRRRSGASRLAKDKEYLRRSQWLKSWLDEGAVWSELPGCSCYGSAMALFKERFGAQAVETPGPPDTRMPVSFKVHGAVATKPLGRTRHPPPPPPRAAGSEPTPSAGSRAPAPRAASASSGETTASEKEEERPRKRSGKKADRPRRRSSREADRSKRRSRESSSEAPRKRDSSRSRRRSKKASEQDIAALSAATSKAAGAPPAGDAYAARPAPLALLRAYAGEDRKVKHRKGKVLFEDDGVQYPAFTLLPLREERDSLTLLSLVSVWLLLDLGPRYEAEATPELLARLNAVRIRTRYRSVLLDFLQGKSESCPLLLSAGDCASLVPEPTPTRLRRTSPSPGRRRLSPRTLRRLPGPSLSQEREPSPRRGRRKRRRRAGSEPQDEDEALAAEIVKILEARAEAEAKLCRVEAEAGALRGLMQELQAQLEATDREIAAARAEDELLRQEHTQELARGGSEGDEGLGAKRRRGTPPAEDPLARLLGPLGLVGLPIAE